MDIRLAAIDLDDTLLRRDLTISPANREACREIRRRGVVLTLASGRTIHTMGKYAAQLGIEGPGSFLVCNNGAEIRDMGSGTRVYEKKMPPDLCFEAARLLTERGLPYHFYADEGLILTSRHDRWTEEDHRLTGLPVRVMDDPEPYLARGQLKFVATGDPSVVRRIYPELRSLLEGRAEVITSKPYFLEVLACGIDKGSALEVLAGRLGIEMEAVLAVGDALNDLSMVRKAGYGCAPSNAVPEVLAAARYVSNLSHEEDAVAEILDRFVLRD